jgi:hypothetical protein
LCTPESAATPTGSYKSLLDSSVGTGDHYEKPSSLSQVAIEGGRRS